MNSPSEVTTNAKPGDETVYVKAPPFHEPAMAISQSVVHKESPVSQSEGCKTCYGTGRYGANGESPCPDCSQSVEEELHLILLPAELVPDLEAQITNQIKDLLSTILSTLVKEMEGKLKTIDTVAHEKRRLNEECICDICDDISFNAGINKAIEVIQSRYLR